MSEAAEQLFDWAAAKSLSLCGQDEVLLLSFYGEDSTFVRINRGKSRQAGQVTQMQLDLTLVHERRSVESRLHLCGEPDQDAGIIADEIRTLRFLLDHVSDDPFLHFARKSLVSSTNMAFGSEDFASALDTVFRAADRTDLVGLWASGRQFYGFASSFGSRCWHATGSFNLDASVHSTSGQSVKISYAGNAWDEQTLIKKVDQAKSWLERMNHTPWVPVPGQHRVYLSPRALGDILQVVCYGGFGRRAHAAKRSPLLAFHSGDRLLHESVNISEDRSKGFLPAFSATGFCLPANVALVNKGQPVDLLTDARSAVEYEKAINADHEFPDSLILEHGQLDEDRVLEELGSGLYINNLWYTNLSNLQDCQVTGTTRFACFRVDEGRFTAPLQTCRFDDSVYNLLGEQLLGLTSHQECLIDAGTYGRRSARCMRLPGALIADMRFVM